MTTISLKLPLRNELLCLWETTPHGQRDVRMAWVTDHYLLAHPECLSLAITEALENVLRESEGFLC